MIPNGRDAAAYWEDHRLGIYQSICVEQSKGGNTRGKKWPREVARNKIRTFCENRS